MCHTCQISGFALVDDEFVECVPSEACLVGNYECAAGYEGERCSKCAIGYYRLGSECATCSTSELFKGMRAVAILIAMLANGGHMHNLFICRRCTKAKLRFAK